MEPANRATVITPSQTLAIDAKAKQLRAAGEDVIGLAAGEPDFDTPEHIKAAAMGALEAGFTKYTPSSGIPELRQAIAEKFKADNDLDYEPSQIIVSCGAKHSCFNAMLAVINEGDEVIIPAPYWLSYPEMVRMVGGEPYIVETTAESGYKLTPDQLRENISPGTKMLILNSPSNPTGAVYTETELVELAEIALEEQIYILSDEIYEKLVYGEAKHTSIAAFTDTTLENTIVVNGFSKSYAMTGWRLGYLAAPKAIAKAIDSIQSHSTSNPTSFAQKGGLAALKGPQDCVEEMRLKFDERRRRMHELLKNMPSVGVVEPQGAFYMMVDISAFGIDSTSFCTQLLEKEKVALVPGLAFGNDRTVRMSFATDLENIEKALGRFARFCQSLR
ncbi:MAG TPA: pyridoxal phosphate-dependent aminotransferase [Verrucomicrobiae bacterium]|nr:pyridoxal phosphate-dependent aminotransferase [Verrucomicrobiae bacterium]